MLTTSTVVRLAAASLVVAATASTAAAENVEVRLATLAPDGSSWMKVLSKGAAEIETKTEGRVKVKYYAGGVQGDERDAVRKMNLGQLDGAAVTSVGLAMIDESIRVLELPRMFETVEELDYVADKMWPYFVDKFDKKGYKLGDRGDVGWIYFLSKNEVKSVADLKAQKVWMWGDDQLVQAMYKALGVSGVPLGVPEVEPALTTGRINACYSSPLAAVALQWNTKIKYMTSMPMSFAIGATVLKKDVYGKVSADDVKLVTKITKGMQKALRKQIRKDNEASKKTMMRKGVKVTETSPEMLAEFDKAAKEVWTKLTGKLFTKAELEMVIKYRDEYRAKKTAAP